MQTDSFFLRGVSRPAAKSVTGEILSPLIRPTGFVSSRGAFNVCQRGEPAVGDNSRRRHDKRRGLKQGLSRE